MLYEYGTDRPSGEAIVEFRGRSDFEAAMLRNRMYMGESQLVIRGSVRQEETEKNL